jgi:hypothetical protein
LAFKGRDPTRNKIAINNKNTEQVNTLNCLKKWYHIKRKRYIDNKIIHFKDNRNNK